MKRDAIGFDRDLELAWLEATAARVAEGNSPAQVREFLWKLLEGKVAGDAPRSGRGKTATVLLHIWSDVPDEVVPLRDDCLQALTRLSGDQQLGAHWTMAMATYPFFVEVVSAVGRLLALQETVALNQVTRRIAEKWGERSTAVRACRRVVRSIVRWGALRDTTKHGVYARRIVPVPTEPSDFQLLAEGLLRGQGAEAAALDDLSASPALFLFSLPNVGSRAFGSGRLSYSREGVDREMVVLTSQPELASRPAAENRVNAGRTRSTE